MRSQFTSTSQNSSQNLLASKFAKLLYQSPKSETITEILFDAADLSVESFEDGWAVGREKAVSAPKELWIPNFRSISWLAYSLTKTRDRRSAHHAI